MKKIFLLLIVALSSVAANAQGDVGSVSIIPRAGVTFANLTNNTVYYETNNGDRELDSKTKTGFIAGADVEYQELEQLSLLTGLYYSQQGAKSTMSGSESADLSFDLQYLNLPVMQKFYIVKGFAVKAGVQLGYLLKAKIDGGVSIVNGDGTYKNEADGEEFTDNCHRVDFSIPVGISYEYSGLVLDLRYNIGLTKLYKDYINSRNSVISLSLGYKMQL